MRFIFIKLFISIHSFFIDFLICNWVLCSAFEGEYLRGHTANMSDQIGLVVIMKTTEQPTNLLEVVGFSSLAESGEPVQLLSNTISSSQVQSGMRE